MRDAKAAKPILHGRDHAPGGADPIPGSPAAWASMTKFASPAGSNPIPYSSFSTSDPAVFATSASGAPTTPSNISGDNIILLRASGVYLLQARALIAGAAGVERAIFFDPAYSNITNLFSNSPKTYGWLDLHGYSVEQYTDIDTYLGGNSAWVADRWAVVVDTSTAVGYVGVSHAQVGSVTSINLHIDALYFQADAGQGIY